MHDDKPFSASDPTPDAPSMEAPSMDGPVEGNYEEIQPQAEPADWTYEPPGEGDSPAAPEATDWEAEARRFQDQYLRSLAELENARRRFQKEKDENARYASESVIRDLVPFLDNLNLALSYADLNDPGVKNLAEGVRMTLKGCMDMLAERGLKEVEVHRGDPFDPNVHEAMGQEIVPDLPDKAVTQLMGKGYSLHQRLIRPAKVIVNKNQPA
ncbi:MAG: nucleotide exchange factor GrpE [Deltaproteobacteria bacterium]|jgi:molecular chaperone GrpE|nr:nucleotide exchange factor GrpE [Deltaproteobacteria bacterium]